MSFLFTKNILPTVLKDVWVIRLHFYTKHHIMYIVSSYVMIWWWHGTSAKKILRIRLAIVIIIVQFYNLTLHRMTVMITFNKIPYFEVRTCVYVYLSTRNKKEMMTRWVLLLILSYHHDFMFSIFVVFLLVYFVTSHFSLLFTFSVSLLLILRFVCKKMEKIFMHFFSTYHKLLFILCYDHFYIVITLFTFITLCYQPAKKKQ